MTSNLGAQYLNDVEEGKPIPKAVKEQVEGAIKRHFLPEFINRIDDIIVRSSSYAFTLCARRSSREDDRSQIFQRLGRSQVRSIVDVRLAECQKRLITNGKNIKLDVDNKAKDWLADRGYNPLYGARPLWRAIQSELLHPLSQMILNEQVRDGETVKITADNRQNRLVIKPNHEPTVVDGMDDGDEDEEEEAMEVERLD